MELAVHHEDPIDSRIGVHDRNQFEVKLDYCIDAQEKHRHNRYRVETYFFIPKSLGINSYTYSRDKFYSDIQAYIRFKTPIVGLRALVDVNNRDSPLIRLRQLLNGALQEPRDRLRLKALTYELQLFGCVLRAGIRDRTNALARKLKKLRKDPDSIAAPEVRSATRQYLTDVAQAIEPYRQLQEPFSDPALPGWIQEAYEYVDEYLSLVIEGSVTSIIARLDQRLEMRTTFPLIRQELRELLLQERNHRVACGYTAVLLEDDENEHFFYRRSALKKFVMSVLFLEITKEKEGKKLTELLAAIAAGIAMLLSTIAAIASQERYGLNSFPFVVALVIGYMAKDRIKDWLKRYFSAKMTRFWDYNVQIRDPATNRSIGRCREAFSFIRGKNVPKEIRDLRHRDATSIIEVESKPEVVMKYEKDIRFHSNIINKVYGRLHDINDIIRFNISEFLVRTDNPIRVLRHYDPDADAVRNVKVPKVYHLNMVFVLRAGEHGDVVATNRVRVILDKSGIKRLEEV